LFVRPFLFSVVMKLFFGRNSFQSRAPERRETKQNQLRAKHLQRTSAREKSSRETRKGGEIKTVVNYMCVWVNYIVIYIVLTG
jgi:hypothetical protein